jgi:hypothetical protein
MRCISTAPALGVCERAVKGYEHAEASNKQSLDVLGFGPP